jgi:hypothetical protein
MRDYSLSLLMLGTLSISACAQAIKEPAQPSSTRKEPAMTATDHQTTRTEAGKLMLGLLELINSSKSIADFTADRLSNAMNAQAKPFGPGHFGYGGKLTGYWSYSLEVKEQSMHGPRLDLEFMDQSPLQDASAAGICEVDFDQVSKDLKANGFSQEPVYGEHGNIIAYHFDRPGLSVTTVVIGEASDPIEKTGHQCVRAMTIQ